MRYIILFLLTYVPFFCAQTESPERILDEVKKKFGSVQDYIVDVKVKVDVDFIKVPDTEAKFYFKEPDKVHIESKQFAMFPRQVNDLWNWKVMN